MESGFTFKVQTFNSFFPFKEKTPYILSCFSWKTVSNNSFIFVFKATWTTILPV